MSKPMMSTLEFISKANVVHNNLYVYTHSIYKGGKNKINIECKEHGLFALKEAGRHLEGRGCKKCLINNQRLIRAEIFINKAKIIHKDKYDYSNINYKGALEKIEIGCNIHGIFKQTPNAHLLGKGCKKCGLSGRNNIGWTHSKWVKAGEEAKRFNSYKLYIIKCWNNLESFYKIGKTFLTMETRFGNGNNNPMPYDYEVIKIHEGNGFEISKLEKEMHKHNKDNKYIPLKSFSGMHECFTIVNNI